MPQITGRFRMARLDAPPGNPMPGEWFFHLGHDLGCLYTSKGWVDVPSTTPGPPGPQGPQGPQGPKGDTGATGPQGPSGAATTTPYARMDWTGSKDIPGSTHCSCGGSQGTASLGVALTPTFHSGDATQMDLANGRLIARQRGLYEVNASCTFLAHADDRVREVNVRQNAGPIGAVVSQGIPSVGAGYVSSVAATALAVLGVGEYAEITFYQGTVSTILQLTAIRFSFAFLSPAP